MSKRSQNERLYSFLRRSIRSSVVHSGKDRVPDKAEVANVLCCVRKRIAERFQLSAGSRVFARNLPNQCAVRDGGYQFRGDSLLLGIALVVSIEQDVRVNRVHASRPSRTGSYSLAGDSAACALRRRAESWPALRGPGPRVARRLFLNEPPAAPWSLTEDRK